MVEHLKSKIMELKGLQIMSVLVTGLIQITNYKSSWTIEYLAAVLPNYYLQLNQQSFIKIKRYNTNKKRNGHIQKTTSP